MEQTYYISIADGGISKVKSANANSFIITASDEEIIALRKLLDQANAADMNSFLRAHIPFYEYHHDAANHEYDDRMQDVYKMIFKLGDAETRDCIWRMGIIEDS